MSVSSVFSRAAVAAMLFAAGINLAEAASAACRSLEARLVSLQRGAGNQGKAAAFGSAAQQQRAEIGSAESQARRAGCYGGGGQAKPVCGMLTKSIGRMKANLAKLDNQQRRLGATPASSGRERNDLLRQLGANDCGPQYASYSAQTQPRSFLQRLFNPDPVAVAPPSNVQIARVEPAERTRRRAQTDGGSYDVSFGGGKYRTLCVRTCDGYYFPISYSTTRTNFATDEQICRQMCPGTDVALYAHRNPGQDSSMAISTLDKSRYSDLATAFSYRTNLNSSCTCGKSTALDVIAGGYSPATIGPYAASLAPVPDQRPPQGEDPETIANRKGELDPGEVGRPVVATPVAALSVPTNGAVRRVGPSFYYAQ